MDQGNKKLVEIACSTKNDSREKKLITNKMI